MIFELEMMALPYLPVFKGKKVGNILRCENSRAAVAANDFENAIDEICCTAIAGSTNQLPTFVDKNSLSLNAVFFDF